MKSIFSLTITFLFLVGFASLEFKTLQVKIEEHSKISIKGTSNVNSFECVYEDKIEMLNRNIELQPKHQNYKIENAQLHLKAASFDCGGKRINKDFKGLLQTERFPHVDIEVNSINQKNEQFEAEVNVHIAGHTKAYAFEVFNPDKNHFTGDLIIDITDFNLESPKKLMGLIEVNNLIDINFDLFLQIKD